MAIIMQPAQNTGAIHQMAIGALNQPLPQPDGPTVIKRALLIRPSVFTLVNTTTAHSV